MYLPNSLRIILVIIQSITWRTTVNLIRVATFIMYLFGLAMDGWIAVLLASLPCLLECWYIFKTLSLNNAGWAVNNRRGRLLSYPPLCVIWSAGFDLEEVSGLCCSGQTLCSLPPLPSWASLGPNVWYIYDTSAENSLSLSFWSILMNSPFFNFFFA